MGFSVAGATGIILAGFLFYMGTLTAAVFNAQQNVQDAGHLAERRLGAGRQGALTILDVNYDDPNNVAYVNATNTGGVTFAADDIELLMNGNLATSQIVSSTVNGAATSVWAPATQLMIRATAAAAPTDVVVVAPSGSAAFWRI